MNPASHKVTANHLKRDAYLYVRQSTLRQVVENLESNKRQYALRQRAVALGWPMDRVIVIDNDQGLSGASAVDRAGFQRLVADVGMGRAGIVLGLEVSRLARNSSDWHRLLEICALTETLILDEDGLYDPSHYNDRLLLGLKGTMSEAELHVLRARLQGGLLNKARRGELKCPLPVGFVYTLDGRVVLDPDIQVQEAIRTFFAVYERTGAATATVQSFRKEGLKFPSRIKHGPRRGDLVWNELRTSRALQMLHNPRYAGAFFYGRNHQRKLGDGHVKSKLRPREEWTALVQDVHPAYITWSQFEGNLKRLTENAAARASKRRRTPPREGPALLQGLAICGRCGKRMAVRYVVRPEGLVPIYACQREAIEESQRPCQMIYGKRSMNSVPESANHVSRNSKLPGRPAIKDLSATERLPSARTGSGGQLPAVGHALPTHAVGLRATPPQPSPSLL